MIRLDDIADAVAADLNTAATVTVDPPHANEFGLEFTAVRRWRPRFSVEELGEIKVSVVAASKRMVPQDRGTHKLVEVDIDIGIHQRVSDKENDTLDPLVRLTEDISEYFEGRNLTGTQVHFRDAEIKTACEPDFLEEKNVFFSVATLTFLGAE